jgi:DNA modification methylase
MTAVVLRGDARNLPLPDESVDLIVTSPPYWSLRDYRDGGESLAGQIGAEETPAEYIDALVECTAEWMRALKPEGSIFVVIGDKYANDAKWGGTTSGKHVSGLHGKTGIGRTKARTGFAPKSLMGLPWWYAFECADQLGLTLRRDIIWSKVNPLPESTDDRCATRHEYVFHFVRQPRYFSAIDEIREPHTMRPQRRPGAHKARQALGVLPAQTYSTSQRDEMGVDGHPLGKLPGSVWEIASAPLFVPERLEHGRCCGGRKRHGCKDGLDHHAAYPPELVRKITLGWSPRGVCTACGDGRRPVVEKPGLAGGDNNPYSRDGTRALSAMDGGAVQWAARSAAPDRITGYACACTPHADHPASGNGTRRRDYSGVPGDRPQGTYGRHQAGEYERIGPWREYHFDAWTPPPTTPAIVLDPFGGTGTTALVADVLGRTGITVDRSADYCRLAEWRTTDPAERARALQVPKPPPVPDGQGDLFSQEAS